MDIYGIRFGLPCYSVTRKTGETLVRRKVLLVAYSARILYVIASSIRCEYFGPRIFLIRIFATGDPTRPLSLGPSLLSAPSPGFRPRGRLPRRRLLPSRLRSAHGATCARVECPLSPEHVGRQSFALSPRRQSLPRVPARSWRRGSGHSPLRWDG